MRFEPEISDEANNGLHIMRNILRPVVNDNPEVSVSDIWTYAGKCAIEFTGGPTIPYQFGRIDQRDGSGCPAHGNLPNAALGADHLRAVFGRMGFNDRDIVALSGGHTLGKCNIGRSGFDGPWTANPHTFDNSYFTTLLNTKWVEKIVPESGNKQFVDADTGKLMMLPSDMCLLDDPAFRAVVEEYARDESAFFRDFAVSFGQMLGNGHPGRKRRSRL
jgi:catalase (peroxidase I)